jgi:hypothetical protein
MHGRRVYGIRATWGQTPRCSISKTPRSEGKPATRGLTYVLVLLPT